MRTLYEGKHLIVFYQSTYHRILWCWRRTKK